MPKNFGEILTTIRIKMIEKSVASASGADRKEKAWQRAQKLRAVQKHQPDAAKALVRLIAKTCFSPDNALLLLEEIVCAHRNDPDVMVFAGECLDAVEDIDDLNRPAPIDPIVFEIVDVLENMSNEFEGTEHEKHLLFALSSGARVLGRQRDTVAEKAYRKLIELEPGKSTTHYNFGLFLKTRARFEEGMHANKKAMQLSDEENESCIWNAGICATGARDGVNAQKAWRKIGYDLEIGQYGLPEGGFSQVKVRLAEYPLAERDKNTDDPGLEETIWIERLSPCHGIVRSVLYQDLGVDYGDVILFDGAPITSHRYGDTEVPVFPHLSTLEKRAFQFFDFAGTQAEAGQLADVSSDLPDDIVIYPHTENVRHLCASCWRDPDLDHEHHDAMEKNVMTGRIATPGHVDASQLLTLLDDAMATHKDCRLYVPDLVLKSGDEARASVEHRRFDMLVGN